MKRWPEREERRTCTFQRGGKKKLENRNKNLPLSERIIIIIILIIIYFFKTFIIFHQKTSAIPSPLFHKHPTQHLLNPTTIAGRLPRLLLVFLIEG